MLARLRLCLLLIVCGAEAVLGQTATGTILGVIRDPQDAPIPAARVVVTNDETNVARSFKTDATGSYVVPFLAPGKYTVSAEAQGFKFDRHAARNELQAATFGKRRAATARLLLSPTGAMAIEVTTA